LGLRVWGLGLGLERARERERRERDNRLRALRSPWGGGYRGVELEGLVTCLALAPLSRLSLSLSLSLYLSLWGRGYRGGGSLGLLFFETLVPNLPKADSAPKVDSSETKVDGLVPKAAKR